MIEESVWEAIIEERLRVAVAEGKFDNLPGLGKPLPPLGPPDPNWWIKRKLKAEGLSLLPPVLEARLAREKTLDSLQALSTEWQVRERLERLNDQIRNALRSPLPGPDLTVRSVDTEAVISEWRSRRAST